MVSPNPPSDLGWNLDWTASPETVRDAARRISRHVHRTPVLSSRTLNEHFGAELLFKCENFQRAGAFKFRGAANALLSTPPGLLERGVATHSSGNHAAALSLAAQLVSVKATIVMPENAAAPKLAAVRAYGGQPILCAPTLAAREETLETVVQEQGLHVIHPYDDPRIISGQGTAALELLEDSGPLDTLLAPVGGGGLLAGTALAAALHRSPSGGALRVIGCEPTEADDAFQSLNQGRLVPVGAALTIADGLRTSLGERNFAILTGRRVSIVRAEETDIVAAMRLLWERLKVIVEPSAAVPIAALMRERDAIRGQRIGVILSGGNLDSDRLPWH